MKNYFNNLIIIITLLSFIIPSAFGVAENSAECGIRVGDEAVNEKLEANKTSKKGLTEEEAARYQMLLIMYQSKVDDTCVSEQELAEIIREMDELAGTNRTDSKPLQKEKIERQNEESAPAKSEQEVQKPLNDMDVMSILTTPPTEEEQNEIAVFMLELRMSKIQAEREKNMNPESAARLERAKVLERQAQELKDRETRDRIIGTTR